jgi:NDP-sugar pyrophosphorylase family protein
MLGHIVQQLAAGGVERIVVNTHHLAAAFAPLLDAVGAPIHVVHEPEIRGTAGAVAGARSRFEGGPVMLHNGDILAAVPVRRMFEAVTAGSVLLAVSAAREAGTVGLDAARRLVRLRGQRFGREAHGADYVGIACLGPDVVRRLPERGCFAEWLLGELHEGRHPETIDLDPAWIDVGTIGGYFAANECFLRTGANREERSWVGEDAKVNPRVALEGSVVGAGAHVTGEGKLERCVIWPGATVRAPLAATVVGRGFQASLEGLSLASQ